MTEDVANNLLAHDLTRTCPSHSPASPDIIARQCAAFQILQSDSPLCPYRQSDYSRRTTRPGNVSINGDGKIDSEFLGESGIAGGNPEALSMDSTDPAPVKTLTRNALDADPRLMRARREAGENSGGDRIPKELRDALLRARATVRS